MAALIDNMYLPSEAKWPKRETDCSSLSSAHVKNEPALPPRPIYVLTQYFMEWSETGTLGTCNLERVFMPGPDNEGGW
jgi:hypothetical protein